MSRLLATLFRGRAGTAGQTLRGRPARHVLPLPPQSEILPQLSTRLQNYFAYVFLQGTNERKRRQGTDAQLPRWLHYLEGPNDREFLERIGRLSRNMWCTGGFLHAAGLAVDAEGKIAPIADVKSRRFLALPPCKLSATRKGITTWTADPASRQRFLFNVHEPERYQSAMTAAMRALLSTLP